MKFVEFNVLQFLITQFSSYSKPLTNIHKKTSRCCNLKKKGLTLIENLINFKMSAKSSSYGVPFSRS